MGRSRGAFERGSIPLSISPNFSGNAADDGFALNMASGLAFMVLRMRWFSADNTQFHARNRRPRSARSRNWAASVCGPGDVGPANPSRHFAPRPHGVLICRIIGKTAAATCGTAVGAIHCSFLCGSGGGPAPIRVQQSLYHSQQRPRATLWRGPVFVETSENNALGPIRRRPAHTQPQSMSRMRCFSECQRSAGRLRCDAVATDGPSLMS